MFVWHSAGGLLQKKQLKKAELQITALAALRAGDKAGEAKLTVSAEGLGQAEICLQLK